MPQALQDSRLLAKLVQSTRIRAVQACLPQHLYSYERAPPAPQQHLPLSECHYGGLVCMPAQDNMGFSMCCILAALTSTAAARAST